jgi:trk system potassium uptake protein
MISHVNHIIGYILILLGISELVPILIALNFNENHLILPFFICSMFTIFIGMGMYFAFHDDREKPSRSEIISFLVLIWFILPIFASLPFMVTGVLTKFSDAYFEAVSAFTTTGSSVIINPSIVPKTVLFWRSFLQWQGGLFLFVVAVSLMPLVSIGGSELFRNALPHGEGEGILERLKSAFKPLIRVYIFLTFSCMGLLFISGMPLFHALATSMSTLSSGGFSTYSNLGVNSYSNFAEMILIPFMFFAATNLTYHWSFFTTGRYRIYENAIEMATFLVVVCAASVLIFIIQLALSEYDPGILKMLGSSLFIAMSAISTTGFVPDGANTMPLAVGIICIFLIFIGGALGSSAGGFKILRLRILFRQARGEINRLAHPHGIMPVRVNDMTVTDAILMSIWTLLFLYLASIAAFSIAYGALGYEFKTSISLAILNLFSSGSMTGLILPDFVGYSEMTYLSKWITSFSMILGRLEIIGLIIFISPSFRRY